MGGEGLLPSVHSNSNRKCHIQGGYNYVFTLWGSGSPRPRLVECHIGQGEDVGPQYLEDVEPPVLLLCQLLLELCEGAKRPSMLGGDLRIPLTMTRPVAQIKWHETPVSRSALVISLWTCSLRSITSGSLATTSSASNSTSELKVKEIIRITMYKQNILHA